MSMSIGKRQIVLATLVVALGAAVFVNWYYTKPDAEKANTGVTVTEEVTQAAAIWGMRFSSIPAQCPHRVTRRKLKRSRLRRKWKMNISHRLGSTAPQRTTKRPKRSKKQLKIANPPQKL